MTGPPKIPPGGPHGIGGNVGASDAKAPAKTSQTGRLQQYTLSPKRPRIPVRDIAQRFLPSLGKGRANGTWLKVRAEVMRDNPALSQAASAVRNADRAKGTDVAEKLWRAVARDFAQQLPQTLQLLSQDAHANLLGAQAHQIAKDTLSNILRQHLSEQLAAPAGGPVTDLDDRGPDHAPPGSADPQPSRPRRPVPEQPPPPPPGKSGVASAQHPPSPPSRKPDPEASRAQSPHREEQSRELQRRKSRLAGLLKKRDQMLEANRRREDALMAPFKEIHGKLRERADYYLAPRRAQYRQTMSRAKVPLSIQHSPKFAEAYRSRLMGRIDQRIDAAPMATISQTKFDRMAALAAREAAQDVQAEIDLENLAEI